MVKYYSNERAQNSNQIQEQQIVESILNEKISPSEVTWQEVSMASIIDADELATLYATVFKVYPTSMSDPSYVRKTMEEGTIYVVIRDKNKIVSAASAEIVQVYSNAELTDCATLPQAQGQGQMKKLLSKLEVRRHSRVRRGSRVGWRGGVRWRGRRRRRGGRAGRG